MTEFIIYGVPGSPYCRAVLAALAEKDASCRFIGLGPGMARSPEHLGRHAFGRVPVLEHAGFILYETQAILRYLDRVLLDPALTPANVHESARMDQLLNICDWYLMQGVNNVIGFHRVVAPRLLGLAPDEAAIAAALPKAHILIDELARLLGNKAYLAADTMTLADILVAAHLDFLSVTPEWASLTADAPELVAWLDRMATRDSFRTTTWEQVAALAEAA